MKLPTYCLIAALTASAFAATAGYPAEQMPGKWLLNGTDADTRFVLERDGSFRYSGWGVTSKGSWSYDGANLKLVYTDVDGQPVKPGMMQARYPVSVDGTLTIYNYQYRKP